jgi:hypothetical protein
LVGKETEQDLSREEGCCPEQKKPELKLSNGRWKSESAYLPSLSIYKAVGVRMLVKVYVYQAFV